MLSLRRFVGTLGVCVFASDFASAQILWKEPQQVRIAAWTSGSGSEEIAPRPPFQFVKEKAGGTNPKIEVRDAAEQLWTVKFGSEVHSDTFGARLLNALGYAAEPTFFVAQGSISNIHDLKRAKHFISKDGSFRSASFKMHQRDPGTDTNNTAWSWVDNPFVGSRELSGLKIVIMLASNWDTKDSRDGEGGNNTIIHPHPASDSSEGWFAVTDWGASFGKSGGFFQRDRWDWHGYRAQTSRFVRLASNGNLEWGFKGKHGADITRGVGVEDIRWLLPYLSRITDEDLQAGLMASGASTSVGREYTRLIRARVLQLQRVAELSEARQAVK